ncbi:MAG TPA: metalloregulator ArsR/SmtB family transcription factor [Mycobacteriales bacterium]|nr:metalloregulator ArsR/SmtB family transcription factor [Mycobacteriales bacterium]
MGVDTTMDVIAEPSRRRILDQLLGGELPVADLVERLELSQPAVSKHLRVLRDAGLVDVRPDGQRRMYRLSLGPLVELDDWLEPYRRMWRDSLNNLERHLATKGTTTNRRPR